LNTELKKIYPSVTARCSYNPSWAKILVLIIRSLQPLEPRDYVVCLWVLSLHCHISAVGQFVADSSNKKVVTTCTAIRKLRARSSLRSWFSRGRNCEEETKFIIKRNKADLTDSEVNKVDLQKEVY
jgi:hypothetical protein